MPTPDTPARGAPSPDDYTPPPSRYECPACLAPDAPSHPCPYHQEISDDDTPCTCCPLHTQECADDI